MVGNGSLLRVRPWTGNNRVHKTDTALLALWQCLDIIWISEPLFFSCLFYFFFWLIYFILIFILISFILVTPCLGSTGGKWKEQLFESWKHSLEIETVEYRHWLCAWDPPGLLKGNVTFPESEEIISVHITQVVLRTRSFSDSQNWKSNTDVYPP